MDGMAAHIYCPALPAHARLPCRQSGDVKLALGIYVAG
jgi:hypothetical protein